MRQEGKVWCQTCRVLTSRKSFSGHKKSKGLRRLLNLINPETAWYIQFPGAAVLCFFHTCQVRVVRFYQSCSSPPPPPSLPPPPPCPLPPCQLFAKLFANFRHLCLHFHVHFRLANSSPSSSPTSARSGHCWTSTARVWAHWAPLDLNLGPSELSEHRWTSTWDPPSSVSTAWASIWDRPISASTAGPQRPDRLPEDMPDRTPDSVSDRMLEDIYAR